VTDENPVKRADRLEPDDKEYRDALRAYVTELTQAPLQGAVYLLIMNGAVLFGTLTLMKDYRDTPIVKGIGNALICFPLSAALAIAAYYSFAQFRSTTLFWLLQPRHEKSFKFNSSYYFGSFAVIGSACMFIVGIALLAYRLIQL
jgi:hypothetical protein